MAPCQDGAVTADLMPARLWRGVGERVDSGGPQADVGGLVPCASLASPARPAPANGPDPRR